MFETTFSYASATQLPATLNTDTALHILHDFETVIKLSPDCRGCKPIPPPASRQNGYTNGVPKVGAPAPVQQSYEVEDDLPFIPKRLWSGGVKYTADFAPVEDGCDITVHAPAGFTSTNHWRLLRETAPINTETIPEHEAVPDDRPRLERTGTKNLMHAESAGAGWYVQIISDARCPRTFAGFVKGALKNSHTQLQLAFIEKLKITPSERKSRPTLGRRRSSVF